MKSQGTDPPSTAETATRVIAAATFAADFYPVRVLIRPKSKLRLAIERGDSSRIEREIARIALDPETLDESSRAEYETVLTKIREEFGDQILDSPFEPPRALIEDLAERALARGSFAAASAALEFLGTEKKRIGELVASALRDLKSVGAPGSSGGGSDEKNATAPFRSAALALSTAVKIKDPLGPLFQKSAADLHFANPGLKEKYYGALLAGNHKEASEICIHYLLGDQEISDEVRRVFPGSAARRMFLRELAQTLSGGESRYIEFIGRYRQSENVLRAGTEKPDFAEAQRTLASGGPESMDGIGLLRNLAVSHPVSSLICRVITLPRGEAYLIPIILEGNSAADILGIA